jgi:hypothetical protein
MLGLYPSVIHGYISKESRVCLQLEANMCHALILSMFKPEYKAILYFSYEKIRKKTILGGKIKHVI